MTLTRPEAARKALHIGMAGFALLLPRLSWGAALGAAGFAALFNVVVLPRVAPYFLRREEGESRFSPGIALYPLVVFVLLLFFRRDLPIAAAGWGYLALGDGFASICGLVLSGPRLPWNPQKTFSGLLGYVVFGFLGASFLYGFVASRVLSLPELICLLAGALAGAAVESLPSELDDNILPPLVGAAVLSCLLATRAGWPDLLEAAALRGGLVALGINAAVGAIILALRLVRPTGALAGALLGTVVLAFGGVPLYLCLWVFFGVGTLATRFRSARKEAIGRAEREGGRRGAANVLANVSVAAFCALVGGLAPKGDVFRLAAAAALATAVMDTVGTEVGQAVASPTALLPDFRRVPPGTDGAVSVAGTLAGLAAAAVLAAAGVATFLVTARGAVAVVAAACLGTVVESLLGRAGAPWRISNGHVLNFVNTLAGAAAAPALLEAFGSLS
ncbi:MAG TPA: DUF92 domain-containing protein [Thermoanaerobaculia bacterium]|nr:DUF92 domain-containing protein [Thermoanaerobaculia bacterium]